MRLASSPWLVAFAAFLLASCRSPSRGSGALETTNFNSGAVDLTTFVIDTPSERAFLSGMKSEMAANGVSYGDLAAKVEALLPDAPAGIADLLSSGALTKEELAGIYFYTTSAYTQLNKPLRAQDATELGKWEKTIRVISSGLNKLPAKACNARRGTGLPPEVLAQLQPNAAFQERAFMSTTLGRIPSAFVKEIELTVRSEKCRPISWLSEYPNEQEALFPPGSEFKVLARRDCPSGARKYCIDLVETPVTPRAVSLATGSEDTEPSNGALGVDRSYRESDFTGRKYYSDASSDKFVRFDTTRKGVWVNTNGENKISDWSLDGDSNVVTIKYRRPGNGNNLTTAYFMVLTERRLGRLRGPNSDRIDEYYAAGQ